MATAERLEQGIEELYAEPLSAYAVPELASDRLVRARASQFIGGVIADVSFEIAYSAESSDTTSLMDAIHKAESGDLVAQKLLETNVRTDLIERTIKAGHIMRVGLGLNEQGHIQQFGQTGHAIQANSLRFASQNAEMLARTKAEVRNTFRIEDLNRQGLLNDYVFIVPSRPAEHMSPEAMDAEGFFTDTMSIAFQATTADGRGGLTTESAFVAGKRNRTAPRQDAEIVERLGSSFGIDMAGKSATEAIDTPWLIPKRYMPNGMIDLIPLIDEAMGGTFFGQDKPRQDYQRYLQECQTRETELEPEVQEIVRQLIAEASMIQTPLAATHRLHELAGARMVRRALTDTRIDTSVFGPRAAYSIEAARHYLEQGDLQQAERFIVKAEISDTSSSCPGAGKKSRSDTDNEEGSGSSDDDDADCEYVSQTCPLCGAKDVKTVDKKIAKNKRRIEGSCGCSLEYSK